MKNKEEKILCVLLYGGKEYFKINAKRPFVRDILDFSYKRLSKEGKKNNIKIIFSKYTDYSNGFVNKYWFFENKWIRKNTKIKPDVFFDKFPLDSVGKKIKKSLSKKGILINDLQLELFCKDKFTQYKKFKDISPQTVLIKSKKDFLEKIDKIKSEKVLLKPRFGHGGYGIFLINKNKKFSKNIFTTDYILQEFIDTTKGVKKFDISGVHDLRCVIKNGKIIYSFCRLPTKGFLANLHQGGIAKIFNPDKKMRELVKKIDKFMKRFGERIYSADFFYSNGKYYLVELNSKPGFDTGNKKNLCEERTKLSKAVIDIASAKLNKIKE